MIYLVSLPFGRVTPFTAVLPTAVAAALVLVLTYRIGAMRSRQKGLAAVLCESEYKSLYSSRQLSALASCQTRAQDMAEIDSQKSFRITEPLIHLTMLMVSLPVLICRDPKAMKSAILVSFALTAACFAANVVCKLLSTEVVFAGRVMPELWAWLPVFILLPIAFIELDAMRT